MDIDRQYICKLSKLIAKRIVSSGSTFLLDNIDIPMEVKLKQLESSTDKAMPMFVEEIYNVREEIKSNVKAFLENKEINGCLNLLNESSIHEILAEYEEKPVKSLMNVPILDLTNIRDSPENSSRKNNESKSSRSEEINEFKVVESPDFVEVSDSSVDNSALVNKIVETILSRQSKYKSITNSSSPVIESKKTNESIAGIEVESAMSSKTKSSNEIGSEKNSTDTVSFYSAVSSNNSNQSIGECKPTKFHKIITVLPDGLIDELKTPRVVDNEELVNEMQYSSHRLSSDSEEILSVSGKPIALELGWMRPNPKVTYVDISSSYNSEPVEVVSARSLNENNKL